MLQGHIVNGAIVPDEPPPLPDGTAVRFAIVAPTPHGDERHRDERRTLADRLGPLWGAENDLPEDASQNLKHYLYRQQKR